MSPSSLHELSTQLPLSIPLIYSLCCSQSDPVKTYITSLSIPLQGGWKPTPFYQAFSPSASPVNRPVVTVVLTTLLKHTNILPASGPLALLFSFLLISLKALPKCNFIIVAFPDHPI